MKTVRVVAAVICDSINEKKQIFATARGYGEFKGQWEFPGGKIEEGETPQQALVREIKEELDADIKVGELIDTIEYDYPTFHLSMDCFWCEVISGEKYTDDEIRIMKKITCKIAGDYLGISSMAVSIGMRNNLLPIGFAVHNEDRDRTYSESWTYHIIAERLIAYKYGRISEVQVQNIEKNLSTIIQQFEEMKKDLVFLLSENGDQQN